MKPYLVDVPVRVNVWIRPECQRRQFEVIKEARPSILFLISDGGRNEKEWEAIHQNRKLVDEGIDWECTVYRIYEDKNNGLYTMGKKCQDLIWSKVDRCIFLEDDIIPEVTYFQYCAELLEKYKDDKRVNVICGMNHLGVSEDVTSDYFFSRQGSIWGCARWKRSINRGDFEYAKDPYIMKLLKQRTKHNKSIWKQMVGYAESDTYGGHTAGGEFYYEFGMYAHNQLQIVPKRNMIKNIGCDASAAHADELKKMPRAIRKLFNMETYGIEFPIKHPQYVIPDVMYEKKRNKTLAYNMPFLKLHRKIETFFIALIQLDSVRVKRKLKKLFGKKDQIEK